MKRPVVIIKAPPIDYSKLLGRMTELHYTRQDLAKAVGVSANALCLWLRTGDLMHGNLIWAICDRLSIETSLIPDYFFKRRLP